MYPWGTNRSKPKVFNPISSPVRFVPLKDPEVPNGVVDENGVLKRSFGELVMATIIGIFAAETTALWKNPVSSTVRPTVLRVPNQLTVVSVPSSV